MQPAWVQSRQDPEEDAGLGAVFGHQSPGGWRKPRGSQRGVGHHGRCCPSRHSPVSGAEEAGVVLAHVDVMTERLRRLKL